MTEHERELFNTRVERDVWKQLAEKNAQQLELAMADMRSALSLLDTLMATRKPQLDLSHD